MAVDLPPASTQGKQLLLEPCGRKWLSSLLQGATAHPPLCPPSRAMEKAKLATSPIFFKYREHRWKNGFAVSSPIGVEQLVL